MTTLRPGAALAAAGCAVVFALVGTASSGRAQGGIPTIYVNTTVDIVPSSADEVCGESNPCSLRLAIRTGQIEETGAFVTACFDPAEVPGAKPCPEGKRPLRKSDPNYDAATGKWVIKIQNRQPIQMTARQTFVDFKRMLTWRGPQDNRVVIDASLGMEHLFGLESETNILSGFEVRGSFESAAILIQPNLRRDPAKNNQIGPGVVLTDITKGVGVRILGTEAFNNKVFGIWCGITGDGTEVRAIKEDCIYIEQGAFGNVIGDVEQPNVLAAAEGSGLRIEQIRVPGVEFEPTRLNEIRGNWLGLDATGASSYGLETGVTFIGSPGNRIIENVISNRRGTGIRLAEAMTETVITDNIIGGDPTGELCRGNAGYGLWLVSGPQATEIKGNRILCNDKGGIFLQATNTRDVTITENRITRNTGKPITLSQGANRGVRVPRITSATRTTVAGTACPGCRVEVFSDPDREAGWFEGATTADEAGAFRFEKAAGFAGEWLAVTATDGRNTSELAEAVKASDATPGRASPTPTVTPTAIGPTPTDGPPSATPTAATPTPTATRDATIGVYLPWLARMVDLSAVP